MSVQELESSHAAAIDITTRGVVVGRILKVYVMTNDTTADVDCDMTVGLGLIYIGCCRIILNIFRELTIAGISRSVEADTNRSQSTTTIDRAQHGAAADVHHYVTTNASCSNCLAAVSTTGTEDVTIDV